MQPYKLNTQVMKKGGSGVQGHLLLCSELEFQASLGYMRHCLNYHPFENIAGKLSVNITGFVMCTLITQSAWARMIGIL